MSGLKVPVTARLEFKPQDCWVGVFWRHEDVASAGGLFGYDLDIWVCLLPMLPLHITWHRAGWGNERPLEPAAQSKATPTP